MAHPTEFSYTYKSLVGLSGLALNTIHQHTRRGNLDPSDLESVVVWLARHGTIGLRSRLVHAALSRELDAKAKPRRRRK